jgi:hypothetical protein
MREWRSSKPSGGELPLAAQADGGQNPLVERARQQRAVERRAQRSGESFARATQQ